MDIEIIRTRRKTIGGYVKDGKITVRAPLRARKQDIELFLKKYEARLYEIAQLQLKEQEKARQEGIITRKDADELKIKAKEFFPDRVKYYADILGVSYKKITIRLMNSRWGSCTSEGNLCFNCLLMLTPKRVCESVIAHELCHRIYMNHSKDFYALLLRIFPDYYQQDKWLKTEGKLLLKRIEK